MHTSNIEYKSHLQVLIILLFSALTVNVALGQATHKWMRTNPGGGGAFSTIEAGPSGQILAGSDLSGAYYSWDFGQTWGIYGAERGVFSTHVSGMGFHPEDEDVFFIGTDNGIFKSINGGGYFYSVLDSGYITDIFVAPSNFNIVYATFHGYFNSPIGSIYKSINGGESFTKVSTNLPDSLRLLELHVSPTDPDLLFVLAGGGRFFCGNAHLYKSANGGVTWTRKASGLGSIMDVAMHPTDHNIIYLTTMNVDCDEPLYYTDLDGDFYQSTNAGENWTLRSADQSGIIWIKRDQPSTIRMIDVREPWPWISSGGTWRSTNSGSTWIQTSDGSWDGGYQSSLAWAYGSSYNGFCKTVGESMADPDVLLWTNPQWIFATHDEGVNFNSLHTSQVATNNWLSTGVDNVVMNEIEVSHANKEVLYAAFADLGVWRSLDRGRSWQSGNTPSFTGNWQGFGGNSLTVVADPTRAAVVWAGMQGDFNEQAYLVKSTSQGASSSWLQSDTGIPNSVIRISGMSLDQTSLETNRKLFVCADGDVYRSTNDGANWSLSFANGGLHFTAIDQINGLVVYAGGRTGIFRSQNGGLTWQDVSLPVMTGTEDVDFFDFGYEGVSSITTDPDVANKVYLTVFGANGGIYTSSDAGSNWTLLYTNPHMRTIRVNPTNRQEIYAGSSSAFYAGGYESDSEGVLYSSNLGANWETVNGSMAWPFANSLAFDLASPPRIYVGSPGSGVQYAYVGGSICQHQLTVTDLSVMGVYQAVESVKSAGDIAVSTSATFRASEFVELAQGFSVPLANEFTIEIGGCE